MPSRPTLAARVCLVLAAMCPATARPETPPPNLGIPAERPLVAVWRDHGGFSDDASSYLRVAVWEDGRVVFARDADRWSHDLLEGSIAAYRVARLKAALAETGVFDLKRTAAVVPDLPQECVLVDLGEGRRRLLTWNEEPTPGRVRGTRWTNWRTAGRR